MRWRRPQSPAETLLVTVWNGELAYKNRRRSETQDFEAFHNTTHSYRITNALYNLLKTTGLDL